MLQTEVNKKVQQLVEMAKRYIYVDNVMDDDNWEENDENDEYAQLDYELVELEYEIPHLIVELEEELLTMFE